jgi:hypothetical protein
MDLSLIDSYRCIYILLELIMNIFLLKRGSGVLFDNRVTQTFIENNNIKLLIDIH